MAIMDQHGLVFTLVTEAFEEQTACQQRELKRLKINADTIAVPGIRSDAVRHKVSEEAIEIEEEQDGSAE